MNRNLLIGIVILIVLVVVAIGLYANNVINTPTTSKPQQKAVEVPPIPLSTAVTIKDCVADPKLLGIKVGETLIVKNADNQEHTLVVEKKITLPANGSVKIPITTEESIIEYTCDGKPSGTLAIAD